jgi:hypothetical protein
MQNIILSAVFLSLKVIFINFHYLKVRYKLLSIPHYSFIEIKLRNSILNKIFYIPGRVT